MSISVFFFGGGGQGGEKDRAQDAAERSIALQEHLDKKERENWLLEEELGKVGLCGFVYFTLFVWRR